MEINKRIALFTAIEDVALVVWLGLVRMGAKLAGVLVLPVGLFFEHVVAYNVKRNEPRALNFSGLPAGKVAVNAILETLVWVIWLALWPLYFPFISGVGIPLLASLFLYPALVIEHSFTDNIFHGRPIFSNLLNRNVLGFSFVEFAGATLWLTGIGAGHGLLGVIALVVLQYVEHAMAIAVGRKV